MNDLSTAIPFDTACCGSFLLDSQGEVLYSQLLKKRLLITSLTQLLEKRLPITRMPRRLQPGIDLARRAENRRDLTKAIPRTHLFFSKISRCSPLDTQGPHKATHQTWAPGNRRDRYGIFERLPVHSFWVFSERPRRRYHEDPI
jgi:hypothetical protein